MEVVCKSDYQDIYRIVNGILLVINKFEYTTETGHCWNCKSYSRKTQDSLRVLTFDYEQWKAGQVFYHGKLVQLTDRSNWTFQIKTTGDAFSGNSNDVMMLLNSIANLIVQYNDETIKEVMDEDGNVCKD